MPTIVASCPHFFVSDFQASLDYYTRVLGFACPKVWGEPPCFALPHRDEFIVMLNGTECCAPSPNGAQGQWDAYFWCTEVDALYAEFEAAGARFAHGPADRDLYGMREIAVFDPDGYMLVFAEDLEKV